MNTDKIREDFPVLKKHKYLDSACMSLKPISVVKEMERYYLEFPACGERSSHKLGKKVTDEFEKARKNIAKFIGAKEEELIFTKNTTEGLNLAANSLKLKKDDAVITSDKEHNSNFLPWLKFKHKALSSENFLESLEKEKFNVVSVVHSSNIDGSQFPIREISKIAHDNGAICVVDGAQSAPHKEIDVKKLGCDIFAFSGHKMLGPSIGCLYIRKDLAEEMEPFIKGGGTVVNVNDGNPKYMQAPQKFEAGLQNYAGAMGLRAAVEYLEKVGMKNIEQHENKLKKIMSDGLGSIDKIKFVGEQNKSGVLSFNVGKIPSTEASIMFDSFSVLLRGGFHCCHNWFNIKKINGSVRASLYFYNNENDVDSLINAAKSIAKMS